MDTPIDSFIEPQDEAATAMVAAPLCAVSADAPFPPSGNTGGKLWTVTDPETGEVFLQLPATRESPSPTLVHLSAADSHPYAAITDFLTAHSNFLRVIRSKHCSVSCSAFSVKNLLLRSIDSAVYMGIKDPFSLVIPRPSLPLAVRLALPI
jgi:hypothetical protein